MTVNDISFFNEVRNECSNFLHNKSKYTLEQSYQWFLKKGETDPFFIYEIEGIKIGYFRTSNWTKNSCYVGMDIHKDFRGKGFAKLAYNIFFEYIKNNYLDIKELKLEVLKSNNIAYRLYKKIGFSEIKRYPYGDDISIIMQLKI